MLQYIQDKLEEKGADNPVVKVCSSLEICSTCLDLVWKQMNIVYRLRQYSACVSAASGVLRSSWSSSTGLVWLLWLWRNDPTMFQERLHPDCLPRKQLLQICKASFWPHFQKHGEHEVFLRTNIIFFARFEWPSWTRWPTSCSSLGSSSSLLPLLFSPSSTSLGASTLLK